jgi:hypothetical protein
MSSFPWGMYSYRSLNYTLPNQINPTATIFVFTFLPILPLFFHLVCKQTIPSPLLSPLTNLWPFMLFHLKEQQSHPFRSPLISLMFRPYSHMDPLLHLVILVCFLKRDQETLQNEHFFHTQAMASSSPFQPSTPLNTCIES